MRCAQSLCLLGLTFNLFVSWPTPLAAQQEASIKIAIAQIVCLDGDREGNLHRIESAIAKAKQQSVDLVCFPEMAILGWVNPEAHQRAHPIPGEDSQALSALAKKYQLSLSIGLAEKEQDRLYDAAILIDDSGKILLKHRKINLLRELMDPPYTAGDSVQVAETRWGKIGLLICADTFQPTTLEKMRLRQPDLLLVPYGWAQHASGWPEHGLSLRSTVQAAAKAVQCPVIGTNLVGSISSGPWRGLTYGGQSYASSPDGEILARGEDRENDLIVFQVKSNGR